MPEVDDPAGELQRLSEGQDLLHPQIYGTSFSASARHRHGRPVHPSGPCDGLTSRQIIEKIVGDAAAYNLAHPGYGFVGDPLRPITGKYYGYLIRAGQY